MPIVNQEVLKTNIVLVGIGLLNEPTQLNAFIESVATDVVVAGAGLSIDIPSNVAEAARTLTLNRDRIALDLSPSRSIIGRDYPSFYGLDRLAEVVGHALAHTDLEGRVPRAFGYNIELVYSPNSEIPIPRYLADRLLTKNDLGKEGWELVGGTSKLVFEGDGARWTFAVEPRFNDEAAKRIFLSLNLHRDEQRLPNESEIKDSLGELWTQAHSFATRLDESAS